MQRRRPRGLGAVGGTGWGSAQRQPLASDSEDEEPPQRSPNAADITSPRVVPESDLEEPDVSPNVPVLRKRLPPNSTLGCDDLDVGGPKKRRLDPKTAPNPGVEPRNRRVSLEEAVGADVERWKGSDPTLGIESDTDDEEHPKSAVLHPNRHQSALERSADPNVAQRTPNLEVGGTRNGRWVLKVDSDTDEEEAELLPPIRRPQIRRRAPKVPRTVGVRSPESEPRAPNEGFEAAAGGSDTDVEESGADPGVERPQNHRVTLDAPEVGPETPGPHPGGPGGDRWVLTVDSDTDVEDSRADAGDLRSAAHRGTRNAPNPPGVEADGPQKGQQTPEVGSDPDVGGPPSRDPDPEVGGSKIRQQLPLVDSDTDVEEDPAYPRGPMGAPKPLTGTGVVMETPNPGLKGPQRGDQSLEVGSDTDVEELNPDVPPPENPKTPQIALQDPAVVTETPNPDVVALNGDSDTDVEDLGGVEAPRTHEATQGFINSDAVAASAPDAAPDAAPDVALAAPNPAVPPAVSPGGGSDTDGEEVAPTPHIRSLRSRIRPRNPNVGSRATSGGADVGQMNPKCGKSTPERQSLAPEACGAGGVGGAAPQRHNSAPQTDTESPKGSDGAQTPSRDASTTGSEAAAAPAPKSPDPAPNLGLAGAGQHRPNGDTDVTEGDTEAEDDPDLFLASTQNFLPPTQNFLPPPTQGGCPPDPTPAWDPEEPTQCFYHPEEEEEKEEEEPPQRRVASRVPTVTPAQDDLGTFTAPSKDVGEGPRRSQRQTRSRGGGASREGGGAKAAGGGATTDPTPLRRSPRLLARPIPAEQKRGRGQDEPRPPPPAPRPRRGGHAPSQKKAREEEEPADITRPQLRPRGSSASSCPKVLFTGVVASPEMEAALGALGGSMAASVFDCTHLVTDRVRRTVKFLCAVARGIAIVTPTWLHQSARSGRVLPPGPFLVQDSQQEQHFGFSLSQALSRAHRRPLLQGYEVHVTPSVRPEPEHMKDIITCSGGTFLPAMPCAYGPRRLVISCPEDAGRWGPALGAHLPLLSAELLLTGLLRQQLQLQPFLLTPPAPPQDPPLSPRRLRDRTHRDPPGTRQRGRLGVQ